LSDNCKIIGKCVISADHIALVRSWHTGGNDGWTCYSQNNSPFYTDATEISLIDPLHTSLDVLWFLLQHISLAILSIRDNHVMTFASDRNLELAYVAQKAGEKYIIAVRTWGTLSVIIPTIRGTSFSSLIICCQKYSCGNCS
jgi:hypothetical protein